MLSTLPPRGNTALLLAVPFLVLSAIGIWEMHLSPAANAVSATAQVMWDSGVLPTNSFHLRSTYTGIPQVDKFLRFLTGIFLPAAAGWDPSSQLQQAYFLVSAGAVFTIWAVEAGRERNRGRITSFTSVWPLFYQTVGGAIIIPLYYVFYLYESARPNYFAPASRQISPAYAKALPPAVILGYVLPTLALYMPLPDDTQLQRRQALVAVWQVTPWILNVLLFLFSNTLFASSSSSSPPSSKRSTTTSSFKPIRILYITIFALCSVAHILTLVVSFRSSNPALAPFATLLRRPLVSDVVPGATPGFFEAIHYIFQVDFHCIFTAVVLGELIAVRDLQAVEAVQDGWAAVALRSVAAVVVLGPAATVVALAGLREEVEGNKAKQ